MKDAHFRVDVGARMGPFELGASRADIMQRATAAGFEAAANDDNDPTYITFDNAEIDLYFRPEEPHALWQVVVCDERARFGNQEVIERTIRQIVELLQVPNDETLWRDGDDDDDCLPENERPPSKAKTDEELIESATLWITTLGLGLHQISGEIYGILLRLPQDSPRSGFGSLTDKQRQLVPAPKSREKPSSTYVPTRHRFSALIWVLNLVLFGAVAWFVFQAVELQQRWNTAVVVESEVVAVDPPPPDPFPEIVTAAYVDQQGTRREVQLRRMDYYAIVKLGDKIELRYLPEAPDQPLGPAKVGDVGFNFAMPRMIVVVGVYLVLNLLINVTAIFWPRFQRAASVG